MVFGGFRISSALTDARDLRLAADRAEVVPAITKYMSALDVALLATSSAGDVEGMAAAILATFARLASDPGGTRERARAEAERLFAPELVCKRISAELERLAAR